MTERTIDIFPDKKTAFKNPQTITLDERDKEVWINSVFGVNKEGQLPARFLSGFLSGFGLAETIQKSTKGKSTPIVRIFIPRHISAFVNGIENDAVESQVQEGTKLLQALVESRFPTIQVFFEKDKPITESALEKLTEVADLFVNETEDVELQRIRESGRRRGGEQGAQNALTYAAHHAFGWSDLHSMAIFEQRPPFTVINALPPSERPFVNVRQTIKQHVEDSKSTDLLCQGKRFDLLMMMSDRPHYLLITDQDGKVLEPTTSDLVSASCGEILDRLAMAAKDEKAPWIRDNLRRARSDFERLLNTIANGRPANFLDLSVSEILGGEV